MVLFSAFGRPIVILRSCSSFIGKDSDLGTFMLFFGTGDGIYQWIPMEQPESEFTFPRTRLYRSWEVRSVNLRRLGSNWRLFESLRDGGSGRSGNTRILSPELTDFRTSRVGRCSEAAGARRGARQSCQGSLALCG